MVEKTKEQPVSLPGEVKLDETQPGGVYLVGGILVNAEGKPVPVDTEGKPLIDKAK